MFFSPLTLLIMVGLFVTLVVLFVVVQIGIITFAFEKAGRPPAALFSLLLLSWIGSWVNIPLTRLRHDGPMSEPVMVRFFGQRYMVPRVLQPRQ
jgi:uncharacterized membrane protein